jgi:mono/diheme cytochrome c family protein
MRVSLIFLLMVSVSGGAAAQEAAGDPVAGANLARDWCAACHNVERNVWDDSASGAPAFQTLATHPGLSEMALRAFLQTPHDRMPDVAPTPEQTADLVTYILSLRGAKSGT